MLGVCCAFLPSLLCADSMWPEESHVPGKLAAVLTAEVCPPNPGPMDDVGTWEARGARWGKNNHASFQLSQGLLFQLTSGPEKSLQFQQVAPVVWPGGGFCVRRAGSCRTEQEGGTQDALQR